MNRVVFEHQQSVAGKLALLGQNAGPDGPYEARVEGEIPASLHGTLYRNGPGMFERNGVKKKHLLDGDGYIQALSIKDQKATYRSRFVQTKKFVAEEKANQFLTPTWSTLAPKTLIRNLGARVLSQAGVTVVKRGDSLIAFDDVGAPYELDWQTLGTRRDLKGDANFPLPSYNAHSFIDSKTKQWLQFGLTYGPSNKIHLSISKPDGSADKQYFYTVPCATYFHDFFVTEKYVVFLIHALRFNPAKMLLGLSSFIDAFKWQPNLGNEIWIISRDNGELISKMESEPAFMWHSLNAYDKGNEIIADFVGYDEPDHFIGDNAEFHTIMQGKSGNAKCPGTVRRYVINPISKTIAVETIANGYHEFPMINPTSYCRPHRVGYFTKGFEADTNLHNGLVKIDMETGATDDFCMGSNIHVGEPVFVCDADSPDDETCGYLLCQFLDGNRGKSGFAVFSAASVSAGPIAKIMMETHSPLSFHGWWTSAV
ncbi:MAG: carotenoid oxygenase family protein [Gammaproteobacteria bacterium]